METEKTISTVIHAMNGERRVLCTGKDRESSEIDWGKEDFVSFKRDKFVTCEGCLKILDELFPNRKKVATKRVGLFAPSIRASFLNVNVAPKATKKKREAVPKTVTENEPPSHVLSPPPQVVPDVVLEREPQAPQKEEFVERKLYFGVDVSRGKSPYDKF